MKAKKFRLSNFEIPHDLRDKAQSIETQIGELSGVNAVRVDPFAQTVTVDFNEGEVSEKEITSILEENQFM